MATPTRREQPRRFGLPAMRRTASVPAGGRIRRTGHPQPASPGLRLPALSARRSQGQARCLALGFWPERFRRLNVKGGRWPFPEETRSALDIERKPVTIQGPSLSPATTLAPSACATWHGALSGKEISSRWMNDIDFVRRGGARWPPGLRGPRARKCLAAG